MQQVQNCWDELESVTALVSNRDKCNEWSLTQLGGRAVKDGRSLPRPWRRRTQPEARPGRASG
eukprot:9756555-Alexandrium_andersonii.AAC.1